MKPFTAVFVLALGAVALTSSPARPQGKVGETAPDFPPGVFSDSMRYQLSDCRGKVVVLFFYESQCPRCKGSIPERNQIVKSFEGKPVKFIAVGASDPIGDVAAYISETKIAMPVFVDNLGLMETRYGQKMSLDNIWQMRVIGPNGKIVAYDMNKETIEKALKGASWKYDPKDYDPKLKSALDAFEWSQWEAGMKLLSPLRRSAMKPVADSANKLYEALKKEAMTWKEEAATIAQQDPVKAYDQYTRIMTLFPSESFAKDLFEPKKKLAGLKAVESELTARKAFEKIGAAMPRMTPEQKKQLAQQLQAFVKKYDGTPIAGKALALAKELEK
jgi:peroxiredoxin